MAPRFIDTRYGVRFWLRSIGAIAALFVLVVGCGGGTGGTGLQDYQGKILTKSLAPVAGAEVTIVQTGDSAVTDERGEFLIRTELDGGDVGLLIEGSDFSSQVVLPDIPAQATIVVVTLELDEVTKTVSTKDIVVEDDRDDRNDGDDSNSSDDGVSDADSDDNSSDNSSDDADDDSENDSDGDDDGDSGSSDESGSDDDTDDADDGSDSTDDSSEDDSRDDSDSEDESDSEEEDELE